MGVTAGQPVLQCQGRYYVIVGGRPVDEPRKGDELSVSGKLLGCSQDGVFYVEAAGR